MALSHIFFEASGLSEKILLDGYIGSLQIKRRYFLRKTKELLAKKRISKSDYDVYRRDLKDFYGISTVVPPKESRYVSKKWVVMSKENKMLRYDKLQQAAFDNLIVGLATSFEEYVRRTLLDYYLRHHKGSLNPKNIKYDSDYLFNLKIHSNVQEAFVAEYIKSLMYGSVASWFKVMHEDLRLDLGQHEAERYSVEELFLVRNAIIHNSSAVTKELLLKNTKYHGIRELNFQQSDYMLFKRNVKDLVHAIDASYSSQYEPDRSASKVIKALSNLSKHGALLGTSDMYSYAMDVDITHINTLAEKYRSMPLESIKTLLDTDFYSPKLVATKILVFQYKHSTNREKGKIFTFCVLNLSCFRHFSLSDYLCRSIFDYDTLNAHNPRILDSMATSGDVYKARIALRVIERAGEKISIKKRSWLMYSIQRYAIERATETEKRKLKVIASRIMANNTNRTS